MSDRHVSSGVIQFSKSNIIFILNYNRFAKLYYPKFRIYKKMTLSTNLLRELVDRDYFLLLSFTFFSFPVFVYSNC